MENLRLEREKYMCETRVIYLPEVINILKNDTEAKGIVPTEQYFKNHPFSSNLFEKNAYYLHYLIMFKSPTDIHYYLENHYKKYGEYATKIFINYPLVSTLDKNVIRPLNCAAMWTTDVDMIRVLYYWGADFSLTDINGKYPDQKYNSYYVNHLNHLIAPNFFIIGLRYPKEFFPVIQEIRILSKEIEPPIHWRSPNSAYTKDVLGRLYHRSPLAEPIPEETSSY